MKWLAGSIPAYLRLTREHRERERLTMKTPTTIQQIENIEQEIAALIRKVEILQLEKDQLERDKMAAQFARVKANKTTGIISKYLKSARDRHYE